MIDIAEYVALEVFKKQPFCLAKNDDGYVHPEPKDVAELMKLAGWSQADAAKIVGVGYSSERGSSTIRKWKTNKASKQNREIAYSAWRLLLLHAGVVMIDD